MSPPFFKVQLSGEHQEGRRRQEWVDLGSTPIMEMDCDAVPMTHGEHLNVTVYGYIYSMYNTSGCRLAAFPMMDNAPDDRSPNIDQINVMSLFRPKPNFAPKVHHACVMVEGANIVISGYILSRPTARKKTFELAIQLYLLRVTKAVDAGYPPPEMILPRTGLFNDSENVLLHKNYCNAGTLIGHIEKHPVHATTDHNDSRRPDNRYSDVQGFVNPPRVRGKGQEGKGQGKDFVTLNKPLTLLKGQGFHFSNIKVKYHPKRPHYLCNT
ncbi:uncharacterized protein LACBIDRAFT_333025 [Laccaria bicolor S238N-H82]|uniref:Predicted protein n=1 Tax=Laccaria bicolor (strain S238N-H82 / ATCC MYA-4686) TaxID=486041 RepID=B0DUL5_LACBS|nr:uncharacterized protein LACBIDRAFT_333025 [Laccaria bicolor S238N-H82]EDR01823.1 predicted protein [Laccaria bicolor S238N-H82]|eukprot:XP_001887636.1 predicted protein [Laccaria bicolor S238N-H82]